MDDLIIICELDEVKKIKEGKDIYDKVIEYKRTRVTWLEMGKKYRRCKDGLKIHNQQHYTDFLPHFKTIENLIEHRNMMAHGYTTYDQVKQNMAVILFENNEKGIVTREFIEVNKFISELEKYRKGILELMNLVIILRHEAGL